MGYPRADEHRLWVAYSALNRKRRRAILVRARKRVPDGVLRGSEGYDRALRRSVVDLLREEWGGEPDAASHLFEVLRRAD